MTKREAINGKPYAGNPHVRFDEGEVASATPRRGSLLYKNMLVMIGVLAFAVVANASSITIDSVAQRWPFNNKLDISYTINGGQDAANGLFCRVVFTASVDNVEYEIDGRKIGADASDGKHIATWTLPDGLKASGCTMTAALLGAENPSGNDYMVVDLATGDVTFEGLLGTGAAGQAASNARYNTDAYKTAKMVLRRVPRWADRASLPNGASLPGAGYPTGFTGDLNANYPNTPTNWMTRADFYIAIFPVTSRQYASMIDYGSGNKRPKASVNWNGIRGGDATEAVAPDASGSALARLNKKTSAAAGITGFDLPTEVMYEIAARAGNTTKFFWGGTWGTYIDTYTIHDASSTADVGSKAANRWGLYDVAGNVWEICLDSSDANVDLAGRADALAPYVSESAYCAVRGGGYYGNGSGNNPSAFTASYRNSSGVGTVSAGIGFRIAYIVK